MQNTIIGAIGGAVLTGSLMLGSMSAEGSEIITVDPRQSEAKEEFVVNIQRQEIVSYTTNLSDIDAEIASNEEAIRRLTTRNEELLALRVKILPAVEAKEIEVLEAKVTESIE